jgi:hypothetical protein
MEWPQYIGTVGAHAALLPSRLSGVRRMLHATILRYCVVNMARCKLNRNRMGVRADTQHAVEVVQAQRVGRLTQLLHSRRSASTALKGVLRVPP